MAEPEQQDDQDVFAPLEMNVSSLGRDLSKVYKVVRTNGEVVEVEADSAAEAVEKSGVKQPIKVVNAAYERSVMIEQGGLKEEDAKALTDINPENRTSLGFLIVDDLEDEEPEPFEEMGLGVLTKNKSQEEAELEPPKVEEPAAEEPPAPKGPDPEKGLSPEEVRGLLNDPDAPLDSEE